MNTAVLVDWVTVVLGPTVLIALGLTVRARALKPNIVGAQLPRWGRAAQSVAIVSGSLLVLTQTVWGG
jgi:hypothetical protein